MNEPYLRLLEVAKALTGSSDIDCLIDAANKIQKALKEGNATWDQVSNYIETGYVNGPFEEFVKTLKIPHPVRGAIPFALYDFQENIIKSIQESSERRVLITKARQMGISMLMSAYALYEAVEKNDQAILIAASRQNNAMEILDRIYYMYDSSSSWLPKMTRRNKTEVYFDNGSRIFARAASSSSIRGLSLTHVIVDEAAYIAFAHENDFYLSVYPQIALGGRFIAYSSPSPGAGEFYRMWTDETLPALRITVPWHVHPDRDEAWTRTYREQLGPERWKQEFECEFVLPDDQSK